MSVGVIKDISHVTLTESEISDFWILISVWLSIDESGVCVNTLKGCTIDTVGGEEQMSSSSLELELKLRDRKCPNSGEGLNLQCEREL
jgi:hypothetical protein